MDTLSSAVESLEQMENNLSPQWKERVQAMKDFDIFPKIQDSIIIRTKFGGFITLICSIIMFLLFSKELYDYLRMDVTSQVSVDKDFKQSIKVNFDITFPALRCDEFGIDMVDSFGDQTLELADNLKKTQTGNKGCRAVGSVEVHKVKGEFHVAFGRKAEDAGEDNSGQASHIHRFTMQELLTFNSSHIINRLSFGEDFPGVVQPLDGMKKIVSSGLGRFQYFLQIVPTTYQYQSGYQVQTNQYSVTENDYIVEFTGGSFKQPGVFFKYELSPYSATYVERYRTFAHFVTQCSAIIGGVFVVAGWLSAIQWYLDRAIVNKPIKMTEVM